MLTKTQKVNFVEEHKKLLKTYKVIGIVQLRGIPDRLLQSTKNQLRAKTKFIIGRKTLLKKILDSSEQTKKLSDELTDTSAILLSNEDPFELYGKFKANTIRLAAKPGQISPDDVSVNAGETGIQPGQTVTDLKSAGIDVQIQKGKVVISKDKVVVKKGEVISGTLAKALHTLDILPFSATIEPSSLISDGMLFSRKVLGINRETTTTQLMVCFNNALGLCFKANIINAYTINNLLTKGYRNAMHLGVEAKVLDSGIIDILLANAATHAAAINSKLATQPQAST
jgi:large subunit ribosomal protein L10